MMTLREKIREISKKHIEQNNSFIVGQCLADAGWVAGTIPELTEETGLVELSMADVMGGGIATGIALMGKRPIYVVRFQGFQWYNSPIIVNYAAKSKAMWNIPCPIFVRSIASEGGFGPVAGSSHHGIYYRMPHIKIASPMTINEYETVYNSFMNDDEVYYVSEHRGSYDNDKEFPAISKHGTGSTDVVLFPFSITRFNAELAAQKLHNQYGYTVSVIHQLWIKPFVVKDEWIDILNSKPNTFGLVLDDDYEGAVAKNIAHTLMLTCNKKIFALGLENKTAGFHPSVDNIAPTVDKIVTLILNNISQYNLAGEVIK